MMIHKEPATANIAINDPLPQKFSSLSTDERNVLVQLTNDNCKSVIKTMQNEGELQIFGDRSVKEGRRSHAFCIKSSSEENAPHVESSAISSGDKHLITSLRTETLSMLGALYLVQSIAKANSLDRKSFQLSLTYDNEERVHQLNPLQTSIAL